MGTQHTLIPYQGFLNPVISFSPAARHTAHLCSNSAGRHLGGARAWGSLTCMGRGSTTAAVHSKFSRTCEQSSRLERYMN